MKGEGRFHHTHIGLMPGVELYVHAVRGARYSVIVDTGIRGMREQVLELVREVGNVAFILITHAHADHIGCNAAVQEVTGAKVAAAGAVEWFEDLEKHYQEFCRTDVLPDSPEQREEILSLMDGGAKVDFVIAEGTSFRLDDELELTTIALPGHKLEEVGFLETHSGTLITGDVLLALAAPFFHGFQTSRGFFKSLAKLERLIHNGQVQRMLASHHHALDAEAALKKIAQSRSFIEEVEAVTLEAANGVPFRTLWERVCTRMNKELEFRGYAMLEVQVSELVTAGRLRHEAGRIYRA